MAVPERLDLERMASTTHVKPETKSRQILGFLMGCSQQVQLNSETTTAIDILPSLEVIMPAMDIS